MNIFKQIRYLINKMNDLIPDANPLYHEDKFASKDNKACIQCFVYI
jgi:hypothetical protein